MAEHSNIVSPASVGPLVGQLDRAFAAVDVLVSTVRPDQWFAATPCAEWSVRQLIDHLIDMNHTFTALLEDGPPPRRSGGERRDEDRATAWRDSGSSLLLAFARPGVLERQYEGPLGSASGADRLQIRLYDLLVHGWDLAQATGQPVDLPDDLAEQSLAFARTQLEGQSRRGRFGPARNARENAAAIDRLAAFLGRIVSTTT